MKPNLRRLGLALGVALPLALGAAAYGLAQDHGTGGPPPMAEHRMAAPFDAREHADRLAEILQLRPDQRPALDAFIASMKPPEGMEHDEGDSEHLTTPERLDRMLAHIDAMRAHMAAAADAAKRFYAQLTPPQQKAFDDLAPMLMGHHGQDGPHMLMRMHEHHEGRDGDRDDMGPGEGPRG